MFRIITGIVILTFGLWLLCMGAQEELVATIPGLIMAGVGVAILLNKKEDDIEKINEDEHK